MAESSMRESQCSSALYQYYSAPEVLPAHGLEYDEAYHPSSDKCAVLCESPTLGRPPKRSVTFKSFSTAITSTAPSSIVEEKTSPSPRIIFGMKWRTFLIVAACLALVIVAAVVGGTVGSRKSSDSAPSPSSTTSVQSGNSTQTTTPQSDCPGSNNTQYTPTFTVIRTSSGSDNSSDTTSSANLPFTKYCSVASNPYTSTVSSRFRVRSAPQAFAESCVTTFDDCIDLCTAYNSWESTSSGKDCDVAVYMPGMVQTENCWIGTAGTWVPSWAGDEKSNSSSNEVDAAVLTVS